MDRQDIAEEIERDPFVPLRMHLISGKTIDLRRPGQAWMLERNMLVLQENRDRNRSGLYDIVSAEAIEKIEQLPV